MNFIKNVLPQTFRTPKLNFLPKTHQNDYKTNLKFRPIVSTINSYCANLSKEITKLLKVHVFKRKTRTLYFIESLSHKT